MSKLSDGSMIVVSHTIIEDGFTVENEKYCCANCDYSCPTQKGIKKHITTKHTVRGVKRSLPDASDENLDDTDEKRMKILDDDLNFDSAPHSTQIPLGPNKGDTTSLNSMLDDLEELKFN